MIFKIYLLSLTGSGNNNIFMHMQVLLALLGTLGDKSLNIFGHIFLNSFY